MRLESELWKSFSPEQRMMYCTLLKKKELIDYLLILVALIGGVVVGYVAKCY